MPAFNRASEITYYEELGVNPDASAEQIRDTFRTLVRLLHPDQQTDLQLKDAAEKQMRKLNRIYAILSDPERRQQYDESLDGNYTPILVRTAVPPAVSHLAGRIAWAGAIVVSVGFLIWLTIWSTPAGPVIVRSLPRSEADGRLANSASSGSEVKNLETQLRTAQSQRDAAVRELNRLRGVTAGNNGLPLPATATSLSELRAGEASNPKPYPAPVFPPPAPAIAGVVPVPARIDVPPPSPLRRRLAGFWFYVKPAQGQRNKNQALYVPEYMEATINELNGGVAGSYRSRYQIVDRAMSPDVNFTFSCTSSVPALGGEVSCPWIGAAGARGELTLHLNSENSLRLDWTATELGTVQGLISGTAVLTRRIDTAN
jgi:hypothetical protein